MGTGGGTHPSIPGMGIRPNPAAGFIEVNGARPGAAVMIFDIAGRMAAQAQADGDGTVEMSVDDLPPGLYCAVCGDSSTRFAVASR
jgi:hypothetical protein